VSRNARIVLTILAALAATGIARVDAARAAGGSTARVLRVQSVPEMRGLKFTFEGTTQTTGSDGSTLFTLSRDAFVQLQQNPYGLVHALKLEPTFFPNGTTFRVQRWYTANENGIRTLRAAVDEFVPTKVRFVDPKSGTFAADQVDRVSLRRSDGAALTFTGKQLTRPVLLKATRIVPLAGQLVSKHLLYRVQAVTIEGNNLVNRAQQAFLPAETPKVTLRLLFYSAKFVARDRIFRFPIGSSITLEYPNGRSHDYKLGSSGVLLLPALPRGNYRVTVHAAGLKMKMPVAMTRDQVATLNVVSYLDVATVVLVLLATAAGLLLVGRPGLRRRLRRPFGRRRAADMAKA
jgi:hypothetical protein